MNKNLEIHKKYCGKLEVNIKPPVNEETLKLLYSPGVADPCLEIFKDEKNADIYTWRKNLVAVISDGSAVLGLGNIGASASLPVMEGKALLLKQFSNLDSVPIVINTQNSKEIIKTIKNIAKSFGAINLEDISAPRCIEIERELINELDIPVFHDDQHGTAIVCLAALTNALKLVKKDFENINVLVSGAGAAGSSIIKLLHSKNVKNILAFDQKGAIIKRDNNDWVQNELAEICNHNDLDFKSSFKNIDVFIGVSAPNIVTLEMIEKMNDKAIVLALANPIPEIDYHEASKKAYIVCTGRSDFPNQVNNVLAFPGIFKGAINAGAKKITTKMKLAAIDAIANLIDEKDLSQDYVVVSPFHEKLCDVVASAVEMAWKENNINN